MLFDCVRSKYFERGGDTYKDSGNIRIETVYQHICRILLCILLVARGLSMRSVTRESIWDLAQRRHHSNHQRDGPPQRESQLQEARRRLRTALSVCARPHLW